MKEKLHDLIDKVSDDDLYFLRQIYAILYRYFDRRGW